MEKLKPYLRPLGLVIAILLVSPIANWVFQPIRAAALPVNLAIYTVWLGLAIAALFEGVKISGRANLDLAKWVYLIPAVGLLIAGFTLLWFGTLIGKLVALIVIALLAWSVAKMFGLNLSSIMTAQTRTRSILKKTVLK